jgi:hypothetical protein
MSRSRLDAADVFVGVGTGREGANWVMKISPTPQGPSLAALARVGRKTGTAQRIPEKPAQMPIIEATPAREQRPSAAHITTDAKRGVVAPELAFGTVHR